MKPQPKWRAADTCSNCWHFWHEQAPELRMTFEVSGEGSAEEIAELVNNELGRLLGAGTRMRDVLQACRCQSVTSPSI